MAEGQAMGGVRWFLQSEGAVVGVLAVWAFALGEANWWLFAALILAPDLAMVGYVRGPRLGAALYNAAHSYVAPGALVALHLATETSWAWPVALIWTAHIGLDRAIGYGLKYPTRFKDTHLASA